MSDPTWRPLDQFGMLLANNNRSKCYLQNLIARDHRPSQVIVMDTGTHILTENRRCDQFQEITKLGIRFNEGESILETLKKEELPHWVVQSDDLNSEEIISAVRECPAEYLIYSGPGGSLLKRGLLSAGKHFLHVHPGWLPDFRGSTVMCYAMLLGESFGCSVIELVEGIDRGPVFYRVRFQLENVKDLDHVLDPAIRTKALLEFLDQNKGRSPKPLALGSEKNGSVFYIIHPVLKHLALLGRRPANVDLVWNQG